LQVSASILLLGAEFTQRLTEYRDARSDDNLDGRPLDGPNLERAVPSPRRADPANAPRALPAQR
jgi:hypothetical protein